VGALIVACVKTTGWCSIIPRIICVITSFSPPSMNNVKAEEMNVAAMIDVGTIIIFAIACTTYRLMPSPETSPLLSLI